LESSLTKIKGKYTDRLNLKQEVQGIAFPFTNNESYKVAFAAKQMGLKVNYHKGQLDGINKNNVEGAFIIEKPSDKELDQLQNMISTEPVILNSVPEDNNEEFIIPKIGLIETYMHDMDAGWTRYVFDSYNIPFEVIRPGELPGQKLEDYDVIVFPDNHKSELLKGTYERPGYYRMSSYPPEYAKGMGKEGLNKLMKYIDGGGKVISWGSSTELFMGKQTIKAGKDSKEEFKLPVSNSADKFKKQGLYIPGSLVKVNLDKTNNFTLGMQPSTGAFYRGDPLFSTSLPIFDMDRRVVGHFPEEDILMSGYAKEIDKVEGKPAIVYVEKGKGQMVFFSFGPQFRASTTRNYKLIFNSLLFSFR
jgi:hypothetical protein